MKRLIQKEWRLSVHPVAIGFWLLSAMLLIPNYPYLVCFFYTTLGIFFTCMTGRENRDIEYMLLLPIRKRDVVTARFSTVVILELGQMLLAIPCAILRQKMPIPGNQTGMDANIALFGLGFLFYALTNWVFLRSYYRNVQKVGLSFLKSSVAGFVMIGAEIALTHTVPFFRDVLDTPDPQHLAAKSVFLLVCAAVFVLALIGTYRSCAKVFEKADFI